MMLLESSLQMCLGAELGLVSYNAYASLATSRPKEIHSSSVNLKFYKVFYKLLHVSVEN